MISFRSAKALTNQTSPISGQGFTLIELLIVIGIISVLSISAVLVLNPAELLRGSRDASRLNDAEIITKALSLYEFASVSQGADFDGPNYSNSCKGQSAQKLFVSVPSDNGETPPTPPLGWTYTQSSSTSLKKVNGLGWLPVDFTNTGDPALQAVNVLPTDPTNTFASGYYYTYICGTYEINLRLESQKYQAQMTSDHGDDDNVFEIGSDLFNTPHQTFAGVSDIQPPTAPSGLSATPTSSSTISLSWTGSTDNVGIAGYKIYRNSSLVSQTSGVGTTYLDQNLLASTTYSYTVSAYDAAGNTSAQSASANATTLAGAVGDAISPSVSITNPINSSNVSGTISVSANASDNVGVVGVQFKLDGSNLQAEDTTSPYGISWNTTSTANGAHVLTAVARDLAGNTSTSAPINITLTNDVTPPVRSNGLPTGTLPSTSTQATLSLQTDEIATCKYGTISGTSYASLPNTFSSTNSTTHSQNVAVSSGSSYNYYVRCQDSLGNQNTTDFTISFSVAASGGGSLPAGLVAGWAMDEIGGTTAADVTTNNNIGNLTNGPTFVAGKYNNGIQFDGVNDFVSSTNFISLSPSTSTTIMAWVKLTSTVASQVIIAKGTAANSQYYIREQAGGAVRFFITAGGSGATLTTAAGVITANTWYHIAGVYNGTDLRIYVNGALVGGPLSKTGNMVDNGLGVAIGGHTDAALPLGGIIDDTRIYNRALTLSEIQTDLNSPLGGGAGDAQAPTTPTGLSATTISQTQINLSWTASTDNVGVTGYRIFRNSVQVATTTGAGVTYNDTGLTASTTYTYTVAAHDAAGNVSPQSSSATTTTLVLDIQAPTTPTGLVVTTTTPSQVSLSWTASTDNVGIAGYRIIRNSIQVATTTGTGTTYTDNGLASSTTYTYQVGAYDAALNLSGLSGSVQGITLAGGGLPQPGDIYEFGFESGTFGTFVTGGNQSPTTASAANPWVLDSTSTVAVRGTYSITHFIPNIVQPIIDSSAASPTIVNAPGHGLPSGVSNIDINGHSNASLNGNQNVTYIDADHFSVPVSAGYTGGTGGSTSRNQAFGIYAPSYNPSTYYSQAYFRFAYKQSTGFDNSNPIKVFRVQHDFDTLIGTVMFNASGANRIQIHPEATVSPGAMTANTNLPAPTPSSLAGGWHWYEFYVNSIDSTHTAYKLWVDDVLYFDYPNVVISGARTNSIFNHFLIGSTFNGINTNGNVWYDYLGMSTQRMGIPP